MMDFSHKPENVIYLAGGCFWGIEHLIQSIPGVIDAQSGCANGTGEEDADYKTVCSIVRSSYGASDSLLRQFSCLSECHHSAFIVPPNGFQSVTDQYYN